MRPELESLTLRLSTAGGLRWRCCLRRYLAPRYSTLRPHGNIVAPKPTPKDGGPRSHDPARAARPRCAGHDPLESTAAALSRLFSSPGCPAADHPWTCTQPHRSPTRRTTPQLRPPTPGGPGRRALTTGSSRASCACRSARPRGSTTTRALGSASAHTRSRT
jgi:hypothetical protein